MQHNIDRYIKESEIDFSASPSINVRSECIYEDASYIPKWDSEEYAATGLDFWLQDPIEKGMEEIIGSFLSMANIDIRYECWLNPRQPINMLELREALELYIDMVEVHLEEEGADA